MFKFYYAWRLRRAQRRLRYVKAKQDALKLVARVRADDPQLQAQLVLDALENHINGLQVCSEVELLERKVM
jgi:hypothetical protein